MTEVPIIRNSQWRCSVRIDLFGNFAKFTGKHLRQSLFLKRLQAKACNFIKKETLAQLFSREFCEISKNTAFTEHFRPSASVSYRNQSTDLRRKSMDWFLGFSFMKELKVTETVSSLISYRKFLLIRIENWTVIMINYSNSAKKEIRFTEQVKWFYHGICFIWANLVKTNLRLHNNALTYFSLFNANVNVT